MTNPKGLFVLYQLKFKTPSVFDLHEGCLFTSLPYATRCLQGCHRVLREIEIA